jgi:hypothetical protein
VKGTPICESGYVYREDACVLDTTGAVASAPSTWPPGKAAIDPSQLNVPQAGPDAQPVTDTITRSRTPAHDSDCEKNWPSTPAAYLFKGGKNFPARKPAVQSAGCVARDMGWSWTSACCPG